MQVAHFLDAPLDEPLHAIGGRVCWSTPPGFWGHVRSAPIDVQPALFKTSLPRLDFADVPDEFAWAVWAGRYEKCPISGVLGARTNIHNFAQHFPSLVSSPRPPGHLAVFAPAPRPWVFASKFCERLERMTDLIALSLDSFPIGDAAKLAALLPPNVVHLTVRGSRHPRNSRNTPSRCTLPPCEQLLDDFLAAMSDVAPAGRMLTLHIEWPVDGSDGPRSRKRTASEAAGEDAPAPVPAPGPGPLARLRAFTSLRALHLSLGAVPGRTNGAVIDLVTSLPRSLTSLALPGNGIGTVGMSVLSSSVDDSCFGKCPDLRELNVSDNPIGLLGASLLYRALISHDAMLTSLRLGTLNVGGAGPADDSHRANAIALLTRYAACTTTLSLSNNQHEHHQNRLWVENADAAADFVASAISACTSLVELDLAGSDMRGVSVAGITKIAEAVAGITTLERVDMSRTGLADDAYEAFVNEGIGEGEVGYGHPGLCALCFGGVDICERVAVSWSRILHGRAGRTSIRELELGRITFEDDPGNPGDVYADNYEPGSAEGLFTSVHSMCCSSKSLSSLSLVGTFELAGPLDAAWTFEYCETVVSIDLSENGLGLNFVVDIAGPLISKATSLRTLKLNDNDLCAECASALAAIMSGSKLAQVHLSGNSLGDAGARCLVRSGVLRHCKLEYLDVSRNGVSDEQGRAMSREISQMYAGRKVRWTTTGEVLAFCDLWPVVPSPV